MARMLEWRHIVPTSPDTLVSYPFKMDDPFALTATPHVLFAGNQPAFGQRLVTGEEGRAGSDALPVGKHLYTVYLQSLCVAFEVL